MIAENVLGLSDERILSAPNQNVKNENGNASSSLPLKLPRALDDFKLKETTQPWVRKFLNVDIVDDLLNAEKADERLRDFAIINLYYRCSSLNLSFIVY